MQSNSTRQTPTESLQEYLSKTTPTQKSISSLIKTKLESRPNTRKISQIIDIGSNRPGDIETPSKNVNARNSIQSIHDDVPKSSHSIRQVQNSYHSIHEPISNSYHSINEPLISREKVEKSHHSIHEQPPLSREQVQKSYHSIHEQMIPLSREQVQKSYHSIREPPISREQVHKSYHSIHDQPLSREQVQKSFHEAPLSREQVQKSYHSIHEPITTSNSIHEPAPKSSHSRLRESIHEPTKLSNSYRQKSSNLIHKFEPQIIPDNAIQKPIKSTNSLSKSTVFNRVNQDDVGILKLDEDIEDEIKLDYSNGFDVYNGIDNLPADFTDDAQIPVNQSRQSRREYQNVTEVYKPSREFKHVETDVYKPKREFKPDFEAEIFKPNRDFKQDIELKKDDETEHYRPKTDFNQHEMFKSSFNTSPIFKPSEAKQEPKSEINHVDQVSKPQNTDSLHELIQSEIINLKREYTRKGGANPDILAQIKILEVELNSISKNHVSITQDKEPDEIKQLKQTHETRMLRITQEKERLISENELMKLKLELGLIKPETEKKNVELEQPTSNQKIQHKMLVDKIPPSEFDQLAIPMYAYNPNRGLSIMWDFVCGLPFYSLEKNIQLIHAQFDGAQPIGEPKSLSSVSNGDFSSYLIYSDFKSSTDYVGVAAKSTSRVILEIQVVDRDYMQTSVVSDFQPLGWTSLDFFDSELELDQGRFCLPVFPPPLNFVISTRKLFATVAPYILLI